MAVSYTKGVHQKEKGMGSVFAERGKKDLREKGNAPYKKGGLVVLWGRNALKRGKKVMEHFFASRKPISRGKGGGGALHNKRREKSATCL